MKYKFCSFRIYATKYDVTVATKGGLTPKTPLRGYTTDRFKLGTAAMADYLTKLPRIQKFGVQIPDRSSLDEY